MPVYDKHTEIITRVIPGVRQDHTGLRYRIGYVVNFCHPNGCPRLMDFGLNAHLGSWKAVKGRKLALSEEYQVQIPYHEEQPKHYPEHEKIVIESKARPGTFYESMQFFQQRWEIA